MNFNNFTIKAQEALQEAVNLVQQNGQQMIEPAHLMAGVLKVGENVTNFIFQKSGVNVQTFQVTNMYRLNLSYLLSCLSTQALAK